MSSTATIQLKPDLEARTISVGMHTVRAEAGKPVEVPLKLLGHLLRSGKFERVAGAEKSEPLDAVALAKTNNKDALVAMATELGIEDAGSLTKKDLAERIVEKNGGN